MRSRPTAEPRATGQVRGRRDRGLGDRSHRLRSLATVVFRVQLERVWDTESVETLPSGTVTFLFTDIEASTRLWEEHPEEMRMALARHDEVVRKAVDAFDGFVFSAAGTASRRRSAGQEMVSVRRWRHSGRCRVNPGLIRWCCGCAWVCIPGKPRSATAAISVRQ